MEERFASAYGDFERWHWWFRGRERILISVLRRELARAASAEPSRPRRIATIGAGPPASLELLARRLGAGAVTLIGVDADPSGALRRQQRGQRLASGVAFAWGRIERPPLREQSCDAVLALDVIEHVDDDAAALAAATRLVRPDGFVLVTVPALPSLWGNQDLVSHHRRRYTARSLAGTFARAGVPLAWSSYFNTALLPAVAAVRWSRRRVGGAAAAVSDFERGRPGPLNELLERLFASERHLVGRVRLPAGVSLIAVGRPGGCRAGGPAASARAQRRGILAR